MAAPVNEAPFQNHDALDSMLLAPTTQNRSSTLDPAQGTSSHQTHPVDYIPGEPTVPLTESEAFLQRELTTPVLDELFDNLWLVARRSSRNVDSLHRQAMKGRDIMPTEDPKLHLVWREKTIFIKPIPLCLLNHDFWTSYLSRNTSTTSNSYRTIASGFLRSYAFLIQHPTDLQLAKTSQLISDDIGWDRWSKFIVGFRDITDADVAKRYQYGQLRLTRLNWAVRVWHPKSNVSRWYYEKPHWSTIPYIREAAVPLAFIFASLSVMLSSAQVMLTVPSTSLPSKRVSQGGLEAMQLTLFIFSTATLGLSGVILAILAVAVLIILLWQLQWAIRHSRRKERTSELQRTVV